MKRLLLLITCAIFTSLISYAQQVITLPLTPTDDEEITITFDATGTELDGYTGDVYAFTGVTVNGLNWQNIIGGWNDNDNNPQLTRDITDPNVYTLLITPSIFDYYGVSPSEYITELVFVFRSADGAITTTQGEGEDIFISINPTNPPPPTPDNLGIAGDATPGWWTGPDLELSFNENSQLWTGNVSFTDGEIKFRFDNSWDVNFGGEFGNATYNGILVPGGSNIPVVAGDYFVKVDLNAMTYAIESQLVEIPDQNFEQALIDLDIDKSDILDGVILRSEAFNTSSLNLNYPLTNELLPNVNSVITDLTGIEAFENLISIACGGNNLPHLDFSSNTSMRAIYASESSIQSINVLNNPNLTQLHLYNNQIVTLNLINNLLLEELIVQSNLITELDLSIHPNLRTAFCTDNLLTSLNIANGNNANFTIPYGAVSFGAAANPDLECIQVDPDMIGNIGAQPWEYDTGVLFNTDCGTKPVYVYIPDPNFEQALIDLDIDSDGIVNSYILRIDAENTTELNVNFPILPDGSPNPFADARVTITEKISDLTGIEAFINVTLLGVAYHELTTVDLSNNTKLDDLFLSDNLLTGIDISTNTLLTRFGVMRNPNIGVVDVSNNTLLKELFLENTGINTIDLTNNLDLWKIRLENNNLTELNISNNINLTELRCQNNNLTGVDASFNTKLADFNVRYNASLTYLDMRNGNNKNITRIDVRDTSVSCINADGDYVSVVPEDSGVSQIMFNFYESFLSTDCGTVYIPDVNFENYLETHDANGNEVLLGNTSSMGDGFLNNLTLKSSVENVTDLRINTLEIYSIRGIEAFTSLSVLYCQYNQLLELDVTNNAALTVLECEGNQLTELNVTQNPLLRVLGFGPNNLTEIDVSQNLLLEAIWTNGNNLSTINLDANTKLAVYGLSNNPYKYVSLKNGNNTNVFYFEAFETPSLDCINSDALVSVSMLNSGKTFSEDCSTSIAGKWIIAPEPGALKVGPEPGSDLWWYLNKFGDDIAARACYLDDVYMFGEDGVFSNILGTETWVETWQAGSDQCGTPVAPHDGSGASSYIYDQFTGKITLNGQGAYLGLPKVVNGGELPNVPVPDSITYDVSFLENGNVMLLSINIGSGYWTFKFIKKPIIILDDVTAIDCFGNDNGTINISVKDGLLPFTFAWTKDGDPGFNSTNEDMIALAPGSYNLLLTDANGLTASLNNVNITEPPLLTASIANNSTGCSNNATITANGGTPGYTYLWSNGATTDTIDNVPVGTYDVTVTDANGCTTTASIALTVGEAFNPSASVTDVSCFGDSNGVINITNANGTAPFYFSKDGITFVSGEFPYSFNDLEAGTYEIAVRDANGCTGFITKTVSQPAELSVTLVSIQSTCSGESTGSISVATAGGTGGLSYSWTGIGGYTSSQKNISGLATGSYSLTVTDNNGCTALLDAGVPTSDEIVVNSNVTDVLCRGTLTGSIDLIVSGGSGSGFAYSWTGNITSTSEDISNLGSGTNYNVTITDIGSGCTVSESYIVSQPAANLSLSVSKSNATGCEGGTITTTASGGTFPYEYSIDGTTFEDDNLFSGLIAGSFTVWAKDSNGCTISTVVAITDNGKDQFESNNSKRKASLIEIGTTINARIGLATDIDWFQFTPTENGNYDLNLSHSSVNYTFDLYDSSRNGPVLVPTSSTSESKQYALTGNETYFVQITGGLSFDCYQLSISQVASAARSASTKTEVMAINELTVKAYPNPHQGVFNLAIKSPEDGTARIELFNILGQLLTTRDVSIEKDQNTTVKFNDVASGIILYHITIGNQRVNGKVIGKD